MSGLEVSTSCHCFHGKMALASIVAFDVIMVLVSVMVIIKAWSHKFPVMAWCLVSVSGHQEGAILPR